MVYKLILSGFLLSGGGWVNTSTGRSVVTSQLPPQTPQQTIPTSHTELYMLQERVCHSYRYITLYKENNERYCANKSIKVLNC